MSTLRLFSTFIFLNMFIGQANASPVTNIDTSGNLIGFNNLNVNGALYDVLFIEGTFNDVFDGSNFTFMNDMSTATDAHQILNATFELFPNFDINPSLQFGCELLTSCKMYSPYANLTAQNRVSTVATYNTNALGPQNGGFLSVNYDYDSSTDTGTVWASWQVSAVPIPASAWLFCSGLIGLLTFLKRG